jgi:hypothetical protein
MGRTETQKGSWKAGIAINLRKLELDRNRAKRLTNRLSMAKKIKHLKEQVDQNLNETKKSDFGDSMNSTVTSIGTFFLRNGQTEFEISLDRHIRSI